MSRIWSMMDVGKRSLGNAQTGLQTVGHNIANKSTEGFSRQRVEFVANEPISMGRYQIGMGAKTTSVTRTNNQHLEKQLQMEGSHLAYSEAKAKSLGQVEQIFNEQVNRGLNQYVGEFFNAFRELANNPESLAARTQVKESAHFITKDIKRIDEQLRGVSDDLDYQMAVHVEEINDLSQQIAQLNEKIRNIEMTGAPANDERDRRDLLIKKISEKVNIRWAENSDGMVAISAGQNALLVSGYSAQKLEYRTAPPREGDRLPSFEIYFKSTDTATPINVTDQLTGGQVGALLEVRRQHVNELGHRMDELAEVLKDEINRAHQEGYDRYGKKGGLFFIDSNPPDDQAASSRLNLASRLEVADDIKEDVGKIAAAGAPGAPADNRMAHIISSLQHKPIFNEGEDTIDDYYSTLVSRIGLAANRANSAAEAQGSVVSQLKNIRESLSGVSLDEEATKMIEYQKSFDASARLIRTADEMLDTVINLKRY